MKSEVFASQLDESTNTHGKAQLLGNVRYIVNNSIQENFLFCREIPVHTTGEEIYNVTTTFLEEELEWNNCKSMCMDGAPSVVGKYNCFLAKVREKSSDVIATYCCLHRETLVAKTVLDDLKELLDTFVKMVNFIKSRPLNSRLFQLLCKEMGAEHKSLLLLIEVHWLSCGKVLHHIYELREEVVKFIGNQPMC